MKQHKFWALATVVCFAMTFITGYKHKVTSKNISPKAKKYGIIEPTNKVGDLGAVESICRR